jgi:predicted  nucleic acid-binding Zn-ribbon protein
VVPMMNKIDVEKGEVDWSTDLLLPNGLTLSQLSSEPQPGASFSNLATKFSESKTYSAMGKELIDWMYANDTVTIFHSPLTEQYSQMGESEGDFRARLLHTAHELRDKKVEELRNKWEKKFDGEEDDIRRAMDALAEQKAQAGSAKMDTFVKVGSSILGALFGKKSRRSSSSAMSGASRAWKESRDVSRAEDKVDQQKEELEEIEEDAKREIEALKKAMDPMNEQFEEIVLSPYKKNCAAKSVGIAWMPYRMQKQPQLGAAW